jgi:metal-responsive CopG/Arc/MetJ family transcriptional regulator
MAPDSTERFEMRVSKEFLAAIDGWRRHQADLPSRAEAIRRLVEQALGGKPKARARK